MTLHLLLKFARTDPSDASKDTIAEHRKIFEQQGAVWWGKFGKGMADDKYESLKSQTTESSPTYAYLYEGSMPHYKARIADIAKGTGGAKITIPCPEPEIVPTYYRDSEMAVWFKFDELTPLPGGYDINSEYEGQSGDPISLAGQSSLIFIRPKDIDGDEKLTEEQIKQLLEWYVTSSETRRAWAEKRKQAMEENHQWIQPSVIRDMSDEELESKFLEYYNSNTGHKQNLNKMNRDRIIRDGDRFRKTIYYLLDESIGLEERVNQVLDGEYRINGFGRAIFSGFLMDFDPNKYSLWNKKSEMGFDVLGWELKKRGDSPGATYRRLLNGLNRLRTLRPDLNLSFDDVDLFLHTIAAEQEGKEAVRVIIEGPALDDYLIFTFKEGSPWDDRLKESYQYATSVPNYKKVRPRVNFVLFQKDVGFVGHGVVGRIERQDSGHGKPQKFRAHYDPFEPISPPKEFEGAIKNKVTSLPGYNVQHGIKVINKEIFDMIVGAATDKNGARNSWIFQANPNYFDLEGSLKSLNELTWMVNQHKDKIHAGDTVYLWQAGPNAGILAVARTLGEPKQMPMKRPEKDFVKIPDKFGKTVLRVHVGIDYVLPKPILRQSLLGDPVLSEMAILKAPQGSNFPLTEEQAQALSALTSEVEVVPVVMDLSAIHDSFSAGLRASHILFGPRHEEVVRSFVASLATKRFVILTGLSGSGKTQMGIKFGEWLGAGKSLVVPVRPDWTGSEALFGYEDALQTCSEDGRRAWYVPEVLKFMLKAARNRQNPYLIVLDEMNLAHVERYFADVLSGMESMQPCLPNLNFENGHWRNVPGESDKITYPENLFIVGTVNVDETTYMFSPKVLDRANTFEFRVNTEDLSTDVRKPDPCEPGDLKLVRGFLAIARDDSWHLEHPASKVEDFEANLRNLHRVIATGGFEFGHRVFYEAIRFAAMFEAAGEENHEHAMDLQVLQKILPRLHGSRRRLEPTLCALGQFCFNLKFNADIQTEAVGQGFNPLDPPEGEPKLPISFDKIQRMTRILRANQFVSFTE